MERCWIIAKSNEMTKNKWLPRLNRNMVHILYNIYNYIDSSAVVPRPRPCRYDCACVSTQMIFSVCLLVVYGCAIGPWLTPSKITTHSRVQSKGLVQIKCQDLRSDPAHLKYWLSAKLCHWLYGKIWTRSFTENTIVQSIPERNKKNWFRVIGIVVD